MRIKISGWLTILLLGFCLQGFAQVRATSQGYLFRVRFVKGRTYKYIVASHVLVPGAKSGILVQGPLVLEVAGVEGGDGVISGAFGPLAYGTNEVMHKQNLRYRQNNLGKTVDSKQLPQPTVVFSEKAKKPGQSWSASASVNSVGSNSVVTANYRFIGMTTYQGKRVAKLAVKMSSTGQSDTKGTGTILILADDGSIYKSSFALSVNIPKQGRINTTMDMSRQ